MTAGLHHAPATAGPWLAGLRYQCRRLRLIITELRQRVPFARPGPARRTVAYPPRAGARSVPVGAADGARATPRGADGGAARLSGGGRAAHGNRIIVTAPRTAGNPRPRAIPVDALPVQTVLRLPPHIALYFERQAAIA